MATTPPVAVEEAAAEDKEKVEMCNAADQPASAPPSVGDVVAAAEELEPEEPQPGPPSDHEGCPLYAALREDPSTPLITHPPPPGR